MVAVSFELFDSFGPQTNGNPVCGRKIQATAPGEKMVTTCCRRQVAILIKHVIIFWIYRVLSTG
ncbi:hypothetical protein JB92DRAFT_2958794, partial [Gautieria morchelliformis]